MSNRLRASLIGGAVIGGLSAVTVIPQIPFVRLACCIWAILGGALAAYLFIKKSPVPARVGDGAIIGLLAGVVGALIAFAALLLVSFYVTDRSLYEDQIRRAGMDPEHFSYGLIIFLVGLLSMIVQIALSLVGGIIGVALFESRGIDGSGTPPPPPPPPAPVDAGPPGEAYAPPPLDQSGQEAP
ncbi:MAG: hypothetical protein QOJ64_3776 [Acidobacteriota bacterium]|jgi:hypothetical protein|nr:hypothetical protein [Acidobacteriota bacterium]